MKRPIHYVLLFVIALVSCQRQTNQHEDQVGQPERIEPEADYEAISLLGTKLHRPVLSEEESAHKDSMLMVAEMKYDDQPKDLDNIIWLGRRIAYLGRYTDAIQIYTEGLEIYPESYKLYRHRGHRYISIRKFDKAVRDLKKAAHLIEGKPIEIEPDGIPNELNKPLSNTHFNIWYHLGLAYYLKHDFEEAAKAYEQCLKYSKNDDLFCATAYWLYMTYRRSEEKQSAKKLLSKVHSKMKLIENKDYYDHLLLYKGLKKEKDIINWEDHEYSDYGIATRGYGLGNWHLYSGDKEKGMSIFKKIVDGEAWWSFGYIAAESELAHAK
ncbi:tetratricopeptide repeat protein [Fulvivirgaceae bacterium BMA10]|uniref:Tetratricopeptide repeat protein n=1 Tax=Splendidivirga corallicola TaxID=3051826 RepID=A0ABT8KTM3_9BACT|nr:tetratricopeptide repeat protein [Fulvivirgaceae bacterium BMA10]